MNAKLLFVATVALAIASSFAQAANDHAPLTRADVKADVRRAIVDGTLPRTEYGLTYGVRDGFAASTLTRAHVVAELEAAQRTPGYRATLASDYNIYPADQIRGSMVTRGEVKAEVARSIADGSLPFSDYAGDNQFDARRAKAPAASRTFATLAQRLKAAFGREAG